MKEKMVLVFLVVLSFAGGFLVSWSIFLHGDSFQGRPQKTSEPSPKINLTARGTSVPEGAMKTHLVAVTEKGEGVVTPIWVKSEPGSGKILVDIEGLFFWVDTQYSMRLASLVAKDYLNITKENNLIYTISANASVVGGPSAGGPLTVATIAALGNRTLKEGVVMTGSVRPDGSIEQVGEILEKAKAAEKEGFETFLIPEGQLVQTRYSRVEECTQAGTFEICRTRYRSRKINIEERVDIEVKEVNNISQTVKYFFAS